MVGAVLLLIAGWIVAGWVQKHTARMLGAVERVDATLLSFVTQSVRYTILILVMVAVLAQFGVQTTSIIAVLGAAGLAVGLALQGTLANIAAGVLLLFLRPFKIGEYIDAGGIAGIVREIGLFATEFKSYDGIFVMVPNSQLPTRVCGDNELLAAANTAPGSGGRHQLWRQYEPGNDCIKRSFG